MEYILIFVCYCSQEVLEERRAQILCLEKQNAEKKKLLEEEARLAELFRLEALEAEKEKEMALKKSQKEYQMELAKQIEQDKQILVRQIKYLISFCHNFLLAK